MTGISVMAAARKAIARGGAPALAVVAVVALLGGLGANADRLARQGEETQARNAIQGRIQEVADQVTANTDWDDAVARVTNRYDPAWVRENIGVYYTQPRRFSFVYVVDPSDRLVYGQGAAGARAMPEFPRMRATALPLIASVRAQEARRGRFRGRAAAGSVLSRPIQASDLVSLHGGLFILTATLIQPEFGGVLPAGPRSAIVITGKPIDAAFLQTFGERLLLQDPRLAPPGPVHRGDAVISLTDRSGASLARIAWTPHRPGGDMMSIALAPILFCVGLPLALFLRGRRTGRRLAATLDDLALARDEADAANAQKSIFLATMSHEIRTPLNGVLVMAQVMAQHPLAADQAERLGVIRQSSEALLGIVNDVLDLSKIEAGRLDLDPRAFDLSAMAKALDGLFRPVAEEKGLDFTVEIAPEITGSWRGDPDRIRQVTANLISNALKFTLEGRVAVRFGALDQGAVRISVADSGIGLDADQLEAIFEPFRQAENSTARRFGGTGLGLSISRRLIGLMGGRIWAESRKGEGSTFILEVPLERAAPSLAAPAPPPRAARPPRMDGEMRVLGADDNATNRLVLGAILQSLDLAYDLVEDGAAAVKACRERAYDLVLMDIQMPVMDGMEAARRIRAEEAAMGCPRTPIIALTANAMTHQLAEYRAAGLDDCIAKPIHIADLHAAMARVLADEAEAA